MPAARRFRGPDRLARRQPLVVAGRAIRDAVQVGGVHDARLARRQPAQHRRLERLHDRARVAVGRELVREPLDDGPELRAHREEQAVGEPVAQERQRRERRQARRPGDVGAQVDLAQQHVAAKPHQDRARARRRRDRDPENAAREHRARLEDVVPKQRVADRQRHLRRQQRQEEVDRPRAGQHQEDETEREQTRHRGQAPRGGAQLVAPLARRQLQAHHHGDQQHHQAPDGGVPDDHAQHGDVAADPRADQQRDRGGDREHAEDQRHRSQRSAGGGAAASGTNRRAR